MVFAHKPDKQIKISLVIIQSSFSQSLIFFDVYLLLLLIVIFMNDNMKEGVKFTRLTQPGVLFNQLDGRGERNDRKQQWDDFGWVWFYSISTIVDHLTSYLYCRLFNLNSFNFIFIYI